jgi:hypothetical protein
MKHPNRSMVLLAALSGLGLLACAAAAQAQGQPSYRSEVQKAQQTGPTGPTSRSSPAPKVITRTRQPVGTPHKVSSFAPHPTTRRVFGAPIQAPIVSNAPRTEQPKPK